MENSNHATPTNSAQEASSPTPQERQQFVDRSRRMLIQHFSAFDRIDIPTPISEIQDAVAFACLQQLDKQTLSQEQLHAAREEIRENVQHGKDRHAEINLADFTMQCGGDTFYYGDTIFSFAVMGGDEGIILSLHECCRMDTRVYIGDCNGVTRAFLDAECEEWQHGIVELSSFHFLSTFTVKEENLGLMLIFNSQLGIMDFEVLAASLRQKYPLRTDIPSGTKAPRNRGDHILMYDEEY